MNANKPNIVPGCRPTELRHSKSVTSSPEEPKCRVDDIWPWLRRGETRRDAGTESRPWRAFLLDRIAEDVAHLLFHAPTMSTSTLPEVFLHVIFQISNDELRHVSSRMIDITTS